MTSLVLVLASNALVVPPMAAHATLARCGLPRIVCSPRMMGRRKKEVVQEEEADYFALEAESVQARTVQMVDPMKTSLGRESELDPFPGPPVIDGPTHAPDTRPLFVALSLFQSQHMPCDALQEQYSTWLSREPGSGEAALCAAHSVANEIDFDELVRTCDVVSEEDLAKMELIEAQRAAEQGDGEEGEQELVLEMEAFPASFVLGHLNIYRALSWAQARQWNAADPIAAVDSYADVALHQWVRSEDTDLNVVPTGAYQQQFVVHCRDRAGSTDLRASTRDAHSSGCARGRVGAAGPLLAPLDGADEQSTSASSAKARASARSCSSMATS